MNIGSHTGGCSHSCCLRIQDLTVRIGSNIILDKINLHTHCGEIIGLIGPNGAGKSTLIKTILGQQDYNGTIAFSVPGQRNRKPIIGYVPQSPTFDPSDPLSVCDLFSCCMSKRPVFLGSSKAMEEKVKECLSRVNAEELIHHRVGTLSGGELQRVLLALALEPIPNILILDEPLSGVDIEGMHVLMEMLDEIRQTYDLSILMTTHDFSTLERYRDHAILLNHKIWVQGSPKEVLSSELFQTAFNFKGGQP